MSTILAPSSNASKWQMGFNSAFKWLKCFINILKHFSFQSGFMLRKFYFDITKNCLLFVHTKSTRLLDIGSAKIQIQFHRMLRVLRSLFASLGSNERRGISLHCAWHLTRKNFPCGVISTSYRPISMLEVDGSFCQCNYHRCVVYQVLTHIVHQSLWRALSWQVLNGQEWPKGTYGCAFVDTHCTDGRPHADATYFTTEI